MPDGPIFSVVLRGYERFQVDEVTQQVDRASRSGDPLVRARVAEALRSAAFSVVLRGYDRSQVDTFVAQAAAELAAPLATS